MPSRLGQNFLYQPDWQRRVAEAVRAVPGDRLLEIGGGEGHLSELLARAAGSLAIAELDPALAGGLRARFAGNANVEVLEGDVLDLDLSRFDRVAGNLPFYITSPILLLLYRHAAHLRDATLMVQREVADRLLAVPGSRAFGLLSATTQVYCRPRRLFDLPPGAFRPPPKVHSTLLRLEFAPQAEAWGVDAAEFEAFLKVAFAHKRKRLANNLAAWGAAAVAAGFAAAGIETDARVETVPLERLAALFQELRRR